MIEVTFRYDESTRKWEVYVTGTAINKDGVGDEIEAMNAFNAVVLTCQEVAIGMKHKFHKYIGGSIEIIPAV